MQYHITLEADFVVQAKNPGVVRRKLHHLLQDVDWQDKDFEFGIERVKKRKEDKNDKTSQSKTNKEVV